MNQEMNQAVEALDRELTPALEAFPLSLAREFHRGLEHVVEKLQADQVASWAKIGVGLAGQSLRSWEAAAEYYRVSTQVLDQIPFPSFERWSTYGRDLAGESPASGDRFFPRLT